MDMVSLVVFVVLIAALAAAYWYINWRNLQEWIDWRNDDNWHRYEERQDSYDPMWSTYGEFE